MTQNDFLIKQKEYVKSEHSLWESIFCLENGFIGVRNTLEFCSEHSRPGIFISDLYGFGISVPNQILNIPNWLDNKIRIGHEIINLDYVEIKSFIRELNMSGGIICTSITFKDNNDRLTKLVREEFLYADKKNVYVEMLSIEPLNYQDQISIECLFTDSGNAYHGGYQGEFIRSYHWKIEHEKHSMKELMINYVTIDSGRELILNSVFEFENMNGLEYNLVHNKREIGNLYTFHAGKGQKSTVIRTTYISNKEMENDINKVKSELKELSYSKMKSVNFDIWNKKWEKTKFKFEGSQKLKEGLIYSIFKMIQCSFETEDLINIPARGLTSYYHNGHFFFNTDLYMVPYFCLFNPAIAKKLIRYRIDTADVARENASKLGYKGLFWSEESGLEGFPSGPSELIDYKKGISFKEHTGKQVIHIACDVVFSIYYYVKYTGDNFFITYEVLKVIVDAVRFYSDILQFKDGMYYEIKGIMGIDEYHHSINNNFYTMSMIKWLIAYCISLIGEDEITKKSLNISTEEFEKWHNILRYLKLPQIKGQVFEQFDDYFLLKHVEIKQLDSRGLPYIDENLRKELFYMSSFDSQLIKQCDVIMLLSMFPKKYSKEQLQKNFEFYDPKTIHESSLSPIHAGIIAYLIDKLEDGDRYLKIASRYNFDFIPRDDYNNGIHIASYAGAWLMIIHGIFGIHLEGNIICFEIHNGNSIQKISLSILIRGNKILLELNKSYFELSIKKFMEDNLTIRVFEKVFVLNKDNYSIRVEI